MVKVEFQKSLDKINETLASYSHIDYLGIFKDSFKKAFFTKFWAICSVAMIISTLIQYYYAGTALLIASITSLPMIMAPITWGIIQCLIAKSFFKFDTARLKEKKRILEEGVNNSSSL